MQVCMYVCAHVHVHVCSEHIVCIYEKITDPSIDVSTILPSIDPSIHLTIYELPVAHVSLYIYIYIEIYIYMYMSRHIYTSSQLSMESRGGRERERERENDYNGRNAIHPVAADWNAGAGARVGINRMPGIQYGKHSDDQPWKQDRMET